MKFFDILVTALSLAFIWRYPDEVRLAVLGVLHFLGSLR